MLNNKLKLKTRTALAFIFLFHGQILLAESKKSDSSSDKGYTLLSGNDAKEILPGLDGTDINQLFYGFYKWSIGIAVLIALVYVVVGGIQYMTTDAIYDKGQGRKRIQNAFLGLIIALSSYLILNTINESIVKTTLSFDSLRTDAVKVSTGGGSGNLSDTSSGSWTGSSNTPSQTLGGGIIGYDSDGYPVLDTEAVEYTEKGGYVIAENDDINIDFDGSQGAYQVVKDPAGEFTINGEKYKSIGYENLGNAGKADGSNWWGVAKDSSGKVIINADGTLKGQTSSGVDGNKTSFVALTAQQISKIQGDGKKISKGDTIIVTNEETGQSVKAIYGDYGGSKQDDGVKHIEMGPVTAQALGINYGKTNGKSGVKKTKISFSLPD